MSEVTRDVVVRVSVIGHKVEGLTNWAEHRTAADGYMEGVTTGMREIAAEAKLMTAATTEFTESLKSAAGTKLGDMGLSDARAAVQQISDVLDDVGNVNVGGTSDATDDVNDVKSAIESLNEEISQSVIGLEKSWAAADELAAAGAKVETELAAALATAAQEADRLAQAELDAKHEAVEATKAVETATQNEAKSAAESTFKKIALQERLAAHQRKSTEQVLKDEKLKKDAIVGSGEEHKRQLFAASGALAQSLAAGTQFISTLQLIGGESKEIEELAKQFAHVQAVVQGISAGNQAFSSLNTGLTALQASAAAASAQLTLTGGAATFAQGALIRLAPAAAMAQTALGPVAIAVAGIALAVTGVMAVAKYFEDELPDDTEQSRRAFERLNRELDDTKRRIDSNARSLDAQNHFLRAELELRTLLKGGSDAADVDEGLSIDVKTATDTANAKIQSDKVTAKKTSAELQKERDAVQKENDEIFRSGRGITGNKEMTTKNRQTFEDNKRRLWELDSQISEQNFTAADVGVSLSETTMSEFASAVQELPDEQRAAAEQTLKDFQAAIQSAVESAKSQVDSELSKVSTDIAANDQAGRDEISKFEAEQNIALRLQNDPSERSKLEQDVNMASATGNLNAGIDALSGVVSTEREQELRNQLAQGNLTRQKLLEEIADAAEFATEEAQLEAQIQVLNDQRAKLDSTRERLVESQKAINERIDRLGVEVQEAQRAMQGR